MGETSKHTFTLDRPTARLLDRTARALALSKSGVVREAVREYAERLGKLPEAERRRLLQVFDQLVPRIPPASNEAAEQEIAELRRARRAGGRGGK
jgi:hypothetical protein